MKASRKSLARCRASLIAGFMALLAACAQSESDSPSSGGPSGAAVREITDPDAARFLVQSTFGPTASDIELVKRLGYAEWLRRQMNAPATLHLTRLRAREIQGQTLDANAASASFFEAAVSAEDQLRQRMAFALSQLLVVSDAPGSDLREQPLALAYYMDVLTRGALGNYRDLLEEVTYSPAMAIYLTYLRNRKADSNSGRMPDENYAREIMQLFTIGLVELEPDGRPTPGDIETYTNEDVAGLARVFTGMSSKGGFFRGEGDPDSLYTRLSLYPEEHSPEDKTFLNVTLPAGLGPADSISRALDGLIAHKNAPPFISRQIIQRFVTSNPSPAYVRRVASAFATGSFRSVDGVNFGAGRRGDLGATIAAVLLDEEARRAPSLAPAEFGKVREPVLRFTHWARSFNVRSAAAGEETFLRDTSRLDRLSQHPYRSPSVFNFYRPGYTAPGSLTGAAGLTAPELQLVNESAAIGYINTMSRFVRDDTPNQTGASGAAFSPDYSAEVVLAETPPPLLDRISLLLMAGQMSADTRERIAATLAEMPIRTDRAAEDRLSRVHVAVLMAVTAPEYIVQR